MLHKEYILNHWQQYDIVDSKEQMLALLNILEAHNETLDSVHDVYMGNTEFCCSIYYNMGVSNDRETVQAILDHNIFYVSYDALVEACEEDAAENSVTVEEYIAYEDIRETTDGFVRVLWY